MVYQKGVLIFVKGDSNLFLHDGCSMCKSNRWGRWIL